MQQKVIFLGTGGDVAVVSRVRRSAGGIIVRAEGFQFHLDPGPGALLRCKDYNVNPRENTCILVSHGHLNHSSELNTIISAMTYGGLDRKGVVIGNISTIEGTESISPALGKFYRGCVERVITVSAGQKVGVEAVEIHCLKTQHDDASALGFRLYTPTFNLTYSGDTSYSDEIVSQYENTDILILNCVHLESGNANNLSLEDAEKIICKVKPKLCILSHFGNKMLESDPIYLARDLQMKSGVQVVAAIDGLEIHPVTDSGKPNTINTY